MLVRRATCGDMAAIVGYLQNYHRNSNQSDIPFIRSDVVKVLEYAIARKDCLPLVAFNEGNELAGILCVELVPFFFNSKQHYVTDLMFISDGAGIPLLKEMKQWAWAVGANKIMMAVSSGNHRADTFLELSGLEKTGNMYVLRRKSSKESI